MKNYNSPPKADAPPAQKLKICFFIIVFIFLYFYIFIPIVLADNGSSTLPLESTQFTNTFLRAAGFNVLNTAGGVDVRLLVAGLIKIALSLAGLLFFILIFYGGYLWMAAGGNEEQFKKAKAILTKAIIGFVIVLAAYAITAFLSKAIVGSVAPVESGLPGERRELFGPLLP